MKKKVHIRSISRTRKHLSGIVAATVISLMGSNYAAQAQEIDWKVDFNYLLDNTEFDKSSYAGSQTQHAIILRPIVGMKWADYHSLYAGVHLKKIPASDKVVDKTELTLYYDYKTDKAQFRAGIFPRADVLPLYWTQFYSAGYRTFNHPQMQGFFFQLGQQQQSFINLWLDWTGNKGPEQREKYLLGLSGQFKKGLFFADFQSYLHHLSAIPSGSAHQVYTLEHYLLQATAGISFNNAPRHFHGLAAVGVMAGHEVEKSNPDRRYTPVGFVARANFEYCGFGTRNLTYIGQSHRRMNEDFGSLLYLGTSFLRGNFYHRNDLYINLIQSNNIKAEFSSMQHFSEGRVHFQQVVTLKVNLDKASFGKSKTNKFSYPWKKIFE